MPLRYRNRTVTNPIIKSLTRSFTSSWERPFRGEIWDYASQIDLRRGYSVPGKFNINTLEHLREPLRSIKDPSVRMVVLLGAVQGNKSIVADVVVPYWIEHDPGDILWLLETDPKALTYADKRAMPLIKSIPGIAKMMGDIDRNDKTKRSVKFGSCSLTIAGLNESNVQSMSYKYVIIDEAWIARANGLIEQAIDRTRQYPHTKKVLILGQGGWADEDFDSIWKQTDQRELEFACPSCGAYQPFTLARLRDETFPIESLHGTHAGLSWDTNETTKRDGRWDYQAVSRSAHIRCYHCDHRINDNQEERNKLAKTYRYSPTNPTAPKENVGFHWPIEASTRIDLGPQVYRYLRAKTAKDEQGHEIPLINYYQKDRAQPWSYEIGQSYKKSIQEGYDASADWPEERFRVLLVDCQRDLQKFYHSVFSVSLTGECRERTRGILDSFEQIAEVQKKWDVKDQQVFLDCGYEMTRVLRECREHGHAGRTRPGAPPVWRCWTGMKGSGATLFAHRNPKTKAKEFRIYSERNLYNVDVGTNVRGRSAPWYEWSNLACKDLLRARRDQDPGVPKFMTLPDELPETDQASHFCQMRSERRFEEFRSGRKVSVWEPVKKGRPNHYWDIGAMLMAFLAIAGIIDGDAEEDGKEVGGAV